MEKRLWIAFIVIAIFLITILFGTQIVNKITGYAPSQLTNLSITIAGMNPAKIIYISPISGYSSLELSDTNITFNVHMSDSDGVNDLNDTSVRANFTKTGDSTVRQNITCAWINDIDTTTANYTCKIQMWYWDANGAWNITASGRDLGNTSEFKNDSSTFTYGLTTAIVISPLQLTWTSVSPGAINQTAASATTINNTGNKNVSSNAISITAINLYDPSGTNFIPAANFSAGVSGGTTSCIGTALVNGSSTAVANTVLSPGNLSAGGGIAQEDVYNCLRQVPPTLPSQTYSRSRAGSWTIAF